VSFDAIVVIPENVYLSDTFNEAYKTVLNVISKSKINGFEIDFSFMPSTKNINSKLLKYDGYTWIYR
jgi:hypothetical protein